MKKILFLFYVNLLFFNAFPQKQLKSFDEILNSLKAGKNVTCVFFYEKCQLITDNQIKDKSPEAIGGFKIDAWEYFAANSVRNKNAFVSFSKTVLIENPLESGKYVYNYVKVKIETDGKVRIIARYIDAKNYEIIMDESFYTTINDGKNDSGAFFYEN